MTGGAEADYFAAVTSKTVTCTNNASNIKNYPITFDRCFHESEFFELDSNGYVVCKKDGTICCSAEVGVGGTFTSGAYIAGYVYVLLPNGTVSTPIIGSGSKPAWARGMGYVARSVLIEVVAGTKLALAGYASVANASTLGTQVNFYARYL